MHSSRLLSSLPYSICVFGDTWKFILFHFFFYLIPLNYTFKARVKKKFLRNNVMSTSKLSMKLLKHLANRRVAVAVAGIRTTSKFPFDVSVAFTT